MTREQRKQNENKQFYNKLWECVEHGIVAAATGDKRERSKYNDIAVDIEERLIKNRKHRRSLP